MMRCFSSQRRAAIGLAAGGLLGAIALRPRPVKAADGPVAIDKLPAGVRAAADKVLNGVKWSDAYQETDEGKVSYEIDGEDADERDVTIHVSADGKVLSIEQEIALSDLPPNATSAVIAKVPNFHASAAYSIRRGDDLAHGEPSERAFGLDGTDGESLKVSAEVTPDGVLASLEREIAINQVPDSILAALQSRLPMFHATSAHEIFEGDSVAGYVLEGKRGAKGNIETTVFISTDGKQIEIDG